MPPRPRATVLLFLSAALVAGSAFAEPPNDGGSAPKPPPVKTAPPSGDKAARVKQAMALHDEAQELYEKGRYAAAIERLEAALRIDPDGKELVYNLALLHEKLAEMEQAERYYRRYLEVESDPKSRARTQAVLNRIAGARAEMAERRKAAAAREAPAAPIRVEAPAPPAGSRPIKPWVIASGSVAASALVLGTVFAAIAVAKNPGPSARTTRTVGIRDLQDDARAAHTNAIIADVSFLIAAAAAGVTTLLYLTTEPRPAPKAGLRSLGVTF
jgi:tetratricopeptide (TPR) repeat protein